MAGSALSRRLSLVISIVIALFFLFPPAPSNAAQAPGGQAPPVAAAIVREGDFARALEVALGIGPGTDEVAAEDRLSAVGIMPRNGWMADYPVTPDIAMELQQATASAADAGALPFGRDEALGRLRTVLSDSGLLVTPYQAGAYAGAPPQAAPPYPDESTLGAYYGAQGPPIVTYYAPPPNYAYLYWYVDYPFWCSGFFIPGYFILRDFHRFHHHHFVSNHFVRPGTNRVFRVNPTHRFAGQTGVFGGRPFVPPAARNPAGALGPGSPTGTFGPRSPTGTFGPRSPTGTFGPHAFGPPHAFGSPGFFAGHRMAMAAPGGRPSAFGGPHWSSWHTRASSGRTSSAFGGSRSRGGFHGSGGFRGGGSRGGGGRR